MFLNLEYNDEKSLPHQRLSLSLELSYDSRKVNSIEVFRSGSDFKWVLSDLVLLDDAGHMMACYPNMVMPEGENIKTGLYEIDVITRDDKIQKQFFSLNYEEQVLSKKSNELQQWMMENGALKTIIVFDKENKALYFGEQTDNLATPKDIWLQYNQAAYYQEVWTLNSMHLVCKMPAVEIKPGDNNG